MALLTLLYRDEWRRLPRYGIINLTQIWLTEQKAKINPPLPLPLGMQYCVVHALNIVTDATCKDGTMPRSALRNMVMHEQQSCDAICRF